MIKNYYKTLHVHPDADPEIIDVAFRRLAQKYHPDINKDENSASVMAEINEAHKILGNSESRKKYDKERKMYLQERKREKLENQSNNNRPIIQSRWLNNLNTWCLFSQKQQTWIVSEREKAETIKFQLQKFVNDIQELYKITGYEILQTLQRSPTESDIVIEKKFTKKTYVVHLDIVNAEVGLEKIKKFKAEIQKASFTQGAFFIQGRFSKEATTYANTNSIILVDYDSFTRLLYQAREKQNHS